MVVLQLTGAANTGCSNIVSPCLDGKVLQGIAVVNALGRVGLGKLNNLFVILCKVTDNVFRNGRHVQDAVQEISGPEGVQLGAGYIVSQAAD